MTQNQYLIKVWWPARFCEINGKYSMVQMVFKRNLLFSTNPASALSLFPPSSSSLLGSKLRAVYARSQQAQTKISFFPSAMAAVLTLLQISERQVNLCCVSGAFYSRQQQHYRGNRCLSFRPVPDPSHSPTVQGTELVRAKKGTTILCLNAYLYGLARSAHSGIG